MRSEGPGSPTVADCFGSEVPREARVPSCKHPHRTRPYRFGRDTNEFETSEGSESGSASADGSEFSYTPLKSPHGDRTELVHGALAFRDRIYPGKAEGGRIDHFGLRSTTNYGEWSDFEWSGP